MKKNLFLVTVLIILHTGINLLAGALGWYNQLLVVTSTGATAIWITHSKLSRDWRLSTFVVLPFYLIYVPASIYLRSYPTYPIWIFGIIVCCCTYLLLQFQAKRIMTLTLLLFLIAIGRLIVMPNNFSFIDQERDLEQYSLSGVKIVDNKEQQVSLSKLKDKVVLLDIWHSSCGICIRKFPELQELHDYYRNDTNVIIWCLNKPLAKDNGTRPEKWVRPYSFQSLYFADEKEADKLHVGSVPLVLIFDKKHQCRYAGTLNMGWNIFIGNAKTIINRLKNEP